MSSDLTLAARLDILADDFIADVKKAKNEVKGIGNETGKAGKKFKSTTVAMDSFKNMAKGVYNQVFSLKGLFATLGIGFLVKEFINAASVSEQYRIRLEKLLRSVSEGNRLFQDMAEYAGKVPFRYEEIMASATQLAGILKGGVDEIKQWMPLIGDLAAVSGLSIQEATDQVSRMLSAGAASADLFRERGISAMLGFQSGVSYSAKETRKQLMEQWTKVDSQFRGTTENLGNSWNGQVSMMQDKWFQFRNYVMDSAPFDYLKASLSLVNKSYENEADSINNLAKSIGEGIVNLAKRLALGTAALIDSASTPISSIKTLLNGFLETWNSLPAWAQEFGIIGAILGGKKLVLGTAIILGASKKLSDWLDENVVNLGKTDLGGVLTTEKSILGLISGGKDNTGETATEKVKGIIKALDAEVAKLSASAKETAKDLNNLGGANNLASRSMASLGKEEQNLLDKLLPTQAAFRQYNKDLALLNNSKPNISTDQFTDALFELNSQLDDAIAGSQSLNSNTNDLAKSQKQLRDELLPTQAAVQEYYEKLKQIDNLKLNSADKSIATSNLNNQLLDKIISKNDVKAQTSVIAQVNKDIASGIQRSFADTFKDVFKNGINGFKDFGNKLKNLFVNILSEMAAKAAAQKIVVPILMATGGNAVAGELDGAGAAATINPWLAAGIIGGGLLMGNAAAKRQREAEARRDLNESLRIMGQTTDKIASATRVLSGSTTQILENIILTNNAVNDAIENLNNVKTKTAYANAEDALFNKIMSRYDAESSFLDALLNKVNTFTSSLIAEREANTSAINRINGVTDYRNPDEITRSLSNEIGNGLTTELSNISYFNNEKRIQAEKIIKLQRLDSLGKEYNRQQDIQKRAYKNYSPAPFTAEFSDLKTWFFNLTGDLPETKIRDDKNTNVETLIDYTVELHEEAALKEIKWLGKVSDSVDSYATSLSISIDELRNSREEVVRWYEAQKKLAEALTAASLSIEAVLNSLRRADLNPVDRANDSLTSFRSLAEQSKTATGYELADIAKQMADLTTPLLSELSGVYKSGGTYQAFKREIIDALTTVNTRVNNQISTDYEATATAALISIDETIGGLSTELSKLTQAINDGKLGVSQSTEEALNSALNRLGNGTDIYITVKTEKGEIIEENVINTLNYQSENGEFLTVTPVAKV